MNSNESGNPISRDLSRTLIPRGSHGWPSENWGLIPPDIRVGLGRSGSIRILCRKLEYIGAPGAVLSIRLTVSGGWRGASWFVSGGLSRRISSWYGLAGPEAYSDFDSPGSSD